MKREAGYEQHLEMYSCSDGIAARKRPRYDSTEKENRWSLNEKNLILDDLYESGLKPINQDETEDDKQWNNSDTDLIDISCSSLSPDSLRKQISVLESTLMKETLQKLSSGTWIQAESNKPSVQISGINYFNKLSDEVVLHIFHWLPKSYLSNVALVCKRFYELCKDSSLWTRLDVSNRNLAKGSLGHIISKQVMILRLAQSEISHPVFLPGVEAFQAEFSSRLLYLDLSMAHISIESLVDLFNKCSRLKKLSLENVPVDDVVLKSLSRNADIEIINFAMVEGLTEIGFSYLLEKCRHIRELNIAWTYLNSACIKYVCQNLPPTTDRLNFSGCQKHMNDKHVADLVRTCPDLHELDLSDCTALTGQAVQEISCLENLTFLALSRCYLIPYRSFLTLKSTKTLAYLDIHGGYIDGNELQYLKDSLGPLVHLNKFKFSSVARPTVGPRRSSIWGLRVRD